MKNIIDYLKDIKHKSFDKEPFNEVDGLVLAELSYANFLGLLDENSDVDIKEINKKFWEVHTEKEIMASSSYTKMAPFLMKEMAHSKRYKNTRFKNYVTDTSLKTLKQFAAITFSLSDGTDYVAYRGTDGTVVGWMEDFKFSYSTTDGQDDAVNYINKYHKENERPLRIGGHSKGGNLAVYAAIYANDLIQNRIEKVYSYDGPGFKDEVLESETYKRILPKIISIVPKDCMIGIMMHNKYKTIVTNSDSSLILQHDAYQWHIIDNHFEELSSRTEFSLWFERILNDWLIHFDNKKREELLEIFLKLIIENDILKTDNEKLSTNFFIHLITSSSKLTKEEKSFLLSSISEIMVSTTSITKTDIKEIASKTIEEKFGKK